MRGIIFSWSESNILPLEIQKDDYIICADSGIDYAFRCGVKPNLAIGDFDSCDKSRLANYDFEIIKIKAEKDETDTHYAVMTALQKGYSNIIICGGIGGRLDHTLANLSTLQYIYRNGGRGIITDGRTIIHYLSDNSSLDLKYDRSYQFISLWALKDCEDVNIKGLKYELNKAIVTTSFPIGTSNEFIAGKDGRFSIGKGEVIIIITTDK